MMTPYRWDRSSGACFAVWRLPGGLALVVHGEGKAFEPGGGWTLVRAGRHTTLLQAPHAAADPPDPQQLPAPRWVIGEPDSLSAQWLSLLDMPEAYSVPHADLEDDHVLSLGDWPGAADLQAIDIFCGADAQDPTGQRLVTRLVGFVKALIPFRVEQARRPCRLTVVTQRAALDVAEPRASAAWGALRGISQEIAADVGTQAAIEFRLVDLGSAEDLQTLAWLGAHDVRERELAVRGNQVWAPRLIHVRERSPVVSAGEDAAYRLALDNPGQIGGLQMKTYQLGAIGAARRGDRGGSGGAQFPRHHGDAGIAAGTLLRTVGPGPHGGDRSERDRAPRRRLRSHLWRR